MKYLVVLAIFLSCVISSLSLAQTRGIGGGALILDDSLGHYITIETPRPGDPGYAAWVDGGGNSVWKLPIPPFANANAGFVLPGDTDGQLLVWVAPPTGGPQGSWQPMNVADFSFGKGGGGGGGGIGGSGTSPHIPIWIDGGDLGNSLITDDGTTMSYAGTNINTASVYQLGGNTVLSDTGTTNTLLGIGAGFNGAIGDHSTALGYSALLSDGGSNETAVGANSEVDENNALVLGSVAGFNNASNSTDVGIGTTSPSTVLDVEGTSDLINLTYQNEGTAYDIDGDNWTVNTNGQIVSGGYGNPVNNASVTLDQNTHLATSGFGTQITASNTDSLTINYPQSCGIPTDVAGLLDFNVIAANSGTYAQVNFSNSYSGNETVTLTPANPLSAQNLTSFYVNVIPDGSSFLVEETGNPAPGEYQFYYHVIDLGCIALETKQRHSNPR